jgi:hypothetical protein
LAASGGGTGAQTTLLGRRSAKGGVEVREGRIEGGSSTVGSGASELGGGKVVCCDAALKVEGEALRGGERIEGSSVTLGGGGKDPELVVFVSGKLGGGR